MNYACIRCRRAFFCGEEIAYCPFCGSAYADGSAANPPAQVRVSIAADGERTVQEKYWRLARLEMLDVIGLLRDRLDDDGEDAPAAMRFDLSGWLNGQRKCRSIARFTQECEAYLAGVREAMNADCPDARMQAQPEGGDALREFIDRQCGRMLSAICEEEDPAFVPVWRGMARAEKNAQPTGGIPAACFTLFSAVEQAKTRIYAILRENGVYAAFSMPLEMKDGEKDEPHALAQELIERAGREYDLLFDDDYEELILCFWRALMRVTDMINAALCPDEQEQDDGDEDASEALEQYVADWAQSLSFEIDRAYQSASMDMTELYRRLSAIRTAVADGKE